MGILSDFISHRSMRDLVEKDGVHPNFKECTLMQISMLFYPRARSVVKSGAEREENADPNSRNKGFLVNCKKKGCKSRKDKEE